MTLHDSGHLTRGRNAPSYESSSSFILIEKWKRRAGSPGSISRMLITRHPFVSRSNCQGGLVFKAGTLLYHLTLGAKVKKKRRRLPMSVIALRSFVICHFWGVRLEVVGEMVGSISRMLITRHPFVSRSNCREASLRFDYL